VFSNFFDNGRCLERKLSGRDENQDCQLGEVAKMMSHSAKLIVVHVSLCIIFYAGRTYIEHKNETPAHLDIFKLRTLDMILTGICLLHAGNNVSGSLSSSILCSRKYISVLQNDWNSFFLNRGGFLEPLFENAHQ